ncbi:hypothetical protein GGS20DRAFT_588689 [Poronia punctata]|nr:hypothetical protein GGS20DRAFT_588689 [Poronia punctata]
MKVEIIQTPNPSTGMTRRRVASSTPSRQTPESTTANEYANGAVKEPYSVREQPLGTAKHVRVVGIGAGASGLNMIRTLRRNLKNYEHVVYEKNGKVGGTWHENRYPGCRCDVPSHNYQFSWRPNPKWSNFFSPAEEIEKYLDQICEEEHMMDAIRTRHKVIGAWWDEIRGLWDLSVQNLETGEQFRDHANFIVDASGILNNWKWPEIPGLDTFQGELIHTANWPKDFDYANKTVAVIGNGSSGVQVVPAIHPAVEKVYHFVRTPTWVLPPRRMAMMMMNGPAKPILGQLEIDEKEDFSAAQIEKFQDDPEFYRKFVKAVELDINGAFATLLNGGPIQKFATAKVTEWMTVCLGGDEELCRALIPTYPLGCRRMTPAPGYLEALRSPKSKVVTEGIASVVPDGIQLESGETIKVDAIICATGFDTSFTPRFPLFGRSGNIQDKFRQEVPKSYMSCALSNVPNYFTIMGPNAPIGHGSVFTLSEHIARYITRIIQKCQVQGIKAICPSDGAVNDYSAHIASFMPRTSWASSCSSWFKGGKVDGPVTALHPGSRIHFFHMLEQFRGEDWDYTYDHPSTNRFHYLGNGFSTKELDPAFDSTWYLEASADSLLG